MGAKLRRLLYDLIPVSFQIQQDGLGDMDAFLGPDPFKKKLRTTLGVGVFDKRSMDGVPD